MENNDLLKVGIGTKEKPKLKPAKVTIAGVSIKDKKKSGEDMKTPLVKVLVKHPDKEEPIEMTKVKLIKDDKVFVVGLWCQLDEDKKFQKGSAVSELMNFLQVGSLEELEGKEIETVEQGKDSEYLCLKAYK